jgi:hypothetical protein
VDYGRVLEPVTGAGDLGAACGSAHHRRRQARGCLTRGISRLARGITRRRRCGFTVRVARRAGLTLGIAGAGRIACRGILRRRRTGCRRRPTDGHADQSRRHG